MPSVRAATIDDHGHFARLFPELGVDDPMVSAHAWWKSSGDTTVFAEIDGHVVGYAYFQLLASTCYVRNVVSDPSFRRRGVGRALMIAVAERARSARCSAWCLNVKDDNGAAIELYRGLGFEYRYETIVMRLAWSAFDDAELVRATEPLSSRVRDVEDTDAPAIEGTFALPSGLVLAQRKPGRKLVILRDDACILGFAAFDPTFPGAYPFRASHEDAALAILLALRPHARPIDDPGHPWRRTHVQVVVDAAPRVVEALARLQAERVMRILHFAGDLPQA